MFDHQRTYKFGINPKQPDNDGRPYYTLIDEEDEEKFDDLCVSFSTTLLLDREPGMQQPPPHLLRVSSPSSVGGMVGEWTTTEGWAS